MVWGYHYFRKHPYDEKTQLHDNLAHAFLYFKMYPEHPPNFIARFCSGPTCIPETHGMVMTSEVQSQKKARMPMLAAHPAKINVKFFGVMGVS